MLTPAPLPAPAENVPCLLRVGILFASKAIVAKLPGLHGLVAGAAALTHQLVTMHSVMLGAYDALAWR